jgi:hypothetical protein
LLVDDLARSMTYYQKLGLTSGEPWDGFYAIGELDGLELHLNEAPKNDAECQHRRRHVQVMATDRVGEETVVAHLGPGQEFGALAVFESGRRSTTAIAAETAGLRCLNAVNPAVGL